jgi:hypothetical protein
MPPNSYEAPLALLKGLLAIAVALGLLNLRAGRRAFSLITSGLIIAVVPFYLPAMILGSDFTLLFFG